MEFSSIKILLFLLKFSSFKALSILSNAIFSLFFKLFESGVLIKRSFLMLDLTVVSYLEWEKDFEIVCLCLALGLRWTL